MHGLDRLAGALDGSRVDDAPGEAGDDLALVAVHEVVDDGVVEGDAAGREERLVEELLVGEGVRAVLGVDGEEAAHEGDRERRRAHAGCLAEQARRARDVAGDERREVEAQQRVVQIEEDRLDHNRSLRGGAPPHESAYEKIINTHLRRLKYTREKRYSILRVGTGPAQPYLSAPESM